MYLRLCIWLKVFSSVGTVTILIGRVWESPGVSAWPPLTRTIEPRVIALRPLKL